MAEDIVFRSWDKERKDIRLRNHEKTMAILDMAGITPEHLDYQRYYRATMINVHNAYRFSYNGETDAMLDKVLNAFVDTIKDPNVSIDDYEAVTKEFLHQRVASQFQHADGYYAYDATYEDIRNKLNETIQSGMDIRKANNTTYPREFYTQSGSLQRVVMDIPLDMQEESAMRNIDMIVAKYKDKGVDFSSAENAFIVKGQKVGPEKFFTSKISKLDGFLDKLAKDGTILDLNDDELFDILQKGDYEKFIELGKQRGMSRNKTNEALRAALKDEVVFYEVCSGGVERSQIANKIRDLSEKFAKTAQLVSKESEKAVLGRVDRVMFSVVPEDLATQSTLRNWKSCMHTTGCNHQYVDDSIGLGSIVAYGYDSQNPQKSVSRLLIHPYYDENGNVAYMVNDRIYGKDNKGFRRAVEKATEYFNGDKIGIFKFHSALYNDNGDITNLYLFPRDAEGKYILDDMAKDGKIILDNGFAYRSSGAKLRASDKIEVIFNNHIPDGIDLREVENLKFEGNITLGNNVKLPANVGSSTGCTITGKIPDGTDLSHCKSLTLHEANVGNNVKLPELVSISGHIPDGTDLSHFKSLTLHDVTSIGNDVKLPEKIIIADRFPKDLQLDNVKHITLSGECFMGKKPNLPDGITISGHISCEADLSEVKRLVLKDDVILDKDVKLPKDVQYDNVTLKNSKICDNVDFNQIKIGENCTISGHIPDGTDLSNAKNLTIAEEVTFGKDVKLPENVKFNQAKVSGYIPDGIDLREVEDLTLKGNVTFGKDVKLPENVKFNQAKVSGYIPDGINLIDSATLTGDVWLGKDCKYGYECINQDNPPRIHGDAVYDDLLKGADFSKAESLSFDGDVITKDIITKDIIIPENRNVKFNGLIQVDSPDTVHKIAQYDVSNCIIALGNNGEQIHNLPDNINLLIINEKTGEINAITKNAEGKKKLQETLETLFSPNKELDDMPKVNYLTQEEFTKQSGIEFTEAKSLKTEQNIAETSGAKTINETTTKSAEGAVTEVTENATTKSVASEGAELAADATVKTAATKAATTATEKGAKSGVVETIKAVDDKVNTAIDKTIEKGSEKLNNTKVGKAYAKAEKAVANSTVGKVVNTGVKKVGSAVAKTVKTTGKAVAKTAAGKAVKKATAKTVQKTGKAVAKTAAGKAVKNAAAKTVGKNVAKAVGKSLLKKIPLISVGAGLVFGAQRVMTGDWKGAAGEVASGALGTLPGVGTAASVAIDAGLAGRDIYNETLSDEQPNAPTTTNQTSAKLKQQMKTDKQKANNYAAHQRQKLPQSSGKNLRSSMQADAQRAKNKYQKKMEELLNKVNASNDNNEDMNVTKTTDILFQKYGNNAYTLLQEAVLRPNSCISLINDKSLKTQQDVVKYLCRANNKQQVIQNILNSHTR